MHIMETEYCLLVFLTCLPPFVSFWVYTMNCGRVYFQPLLRYHVHKEYFKVWLESIGVAFMFGVPLRPSLPFAVAGARLLETATQC